MKSKLKIVSRNPRESVLEVMLTPETDREKVLISQAETATLSEEDHANFNDYLTNLILSNDYTPIGPIRQTGNSFLFRIANV